MKAIILSAPGPAENLHISEFPIPDPGTGQVLIRTRAISINPIDVKTRNGKGLYARLESESPIIPGWDVAGTVVAVGEQVSSFKPGDRVFGMVNFPGHGKAYAAYVVAQPEHLAIIPENISFEQAAATTLAALTALQAFTIHSVIQANQLVLVHAAAGGVGHFAVQLAKAFGATVIGTSSAKNRDFVLSLGADLHIDYHSTRFEDELSNVDVVLDTIGGEYIDRSLKVLKPGGTIICIPSGLNESTAEKAAAQGKIGKTMIVSSNGTHMKGLANLLEKGHIKAHVSQVFDGLEQVIEAHKLVETGRTVGKVVVKLGADGSI